MFTVKNPNCCMCAHHRKVYKFAVLIECSTKAIELMLAVCGHLIKLLQCLDNCLLNEQATLLQSAVPCLNGSQ